MNGKRLLLILILLISFSSAFAITTYGNTWEEHCDGNICTMSLYSGLRYVYEDEIWKPMEEARSLKDYYSINYLETDEDFNIDVLDFNFTNLILNLTFTGNYSEHEYEIEGDKIKIKLKFSVNGQEEEFEIEYEDGEAIYKGWNYFGSPLSNNFTFGGNSTTIILQDADTENLRDARVYETSPDTNYGTDQNLYVAYNGDSYVYIMFNLSDIINKNISIDSSTLYFYTADCYNDNCVPVQVHHVYNHEWKSDADNSITNETNITWNNQPCGTAFDNSTYCNLTASANETPIKTAWRGFSGMENAIKNEYENQDKNISFALKTDYTDTGAWMQFLSKEYGVPTIRPYLEITYTYTTKSYWYTNQSDIISEYNPSISSYFNITWNTTDSSIANISFVYIEGNWSGSATNYSMTNGTYGNQIFHYNSTLPGGTYYWKSWANTTEGEWNATDSWIFTIGQNTTNPFNLSFDYPAGHFENQNINVNPSQNVKVTGTAIYSDTGTVLLYVNDSAVANPYSTTYGEGYWKITCNTTGNTNYTSNTTTYYITSVSEGGGGGGGGGGEPTIIFMAGNWTIITPNFYLLMSPNSETSQNIKIENKKSEDITEIFMQCLPSTCIVSEPKSCINLCQYVTVNGQNIEEETKISFEPIQPGELRNIPFIVSFNEEFLNENNLIALEAGKYTFSIIVIEGDISKPIGATVVIYPILGYFGDVVSWIQSYTILFPDSENPWIIPNWTISLVSVIFLIVIISLIIAKINKKRAKNRRIKRWFKI